MNDMSCRYYGQPTALTPTHLTTPDCPGRPDSRFDTDTAAAGGPEAQLVGSQIMIVAGPGTGQNRRVVTASTPLAGRCVFELDKPFVGLDGVPLANITLVITAFTGRSLFIDEVLEDCGPLATYNSGIVRRPCINTTPPTIRRRLVASVL